MDRALGEIAVKDTTEDGRWFSVMGQPPVRQVFELALGLPPSVGALDLDRQLTEFRDKTSARFGDAEVAQFSDPAKREELVRVFLLRAELQGGGATVRGASAALSLLQSSGGAGGLLNSLL